MKRRNFFSTLLGGALGCVGVKAVRTEELVADRLRRRLLEVSPYDNHAFHIREHQEMLKPLSLPEMPPEVFEAQQKWKKERGL